MTSLGQLALREHLHFLQLFLSLEISVATFSLHLIFQTVVTFFFVKSVAIFPGVIGDFSAVTGLNESHRRRRPTPLRAQTKKSIAEPLLIVQHPLQLSN